MCARTRRRDSIEGGRLSRSREGDHPYARGCIDRAFAMWKCYIGFFPSEKI